MLNDREQAASRDEEFDDDSGSRDFWFGVIGMGLMVLAAILLAIFS